MDSLTRILAIAGFAAAFLGFGIVELLARRRPGELPSLGVVCGLVLDYRAGRVPVGRIAVYGFWCWLGWHFFAR